MNPQDNPCIECGRPAIGNVHVGTGTVQPPKPNYAEYICRGGHCKCMDKDCTNYHTGDHTCPSSVPTPDTTETLISQSSIKENDDKVKPYTTDKV